MVKFNPQSTHFQSKDPDYVCGSCGTPLSTLITECHNSHKHSQSPSPNPFYIIYLQECKQVSWNQPTIMSPYITHYNTFGEYDSFARCWSKRYNNQGSSKSAQNAAIEVSLVSDDIVSNSNDTELFTLPQHLLTNNKTNNRKRKLF